jgi:hypothetical protein
MRQALPGGCPAGDAGVTLVGFDQHSADIIAARMMGHHPDDVVPLSGTQADQAHPARSCLIDRIGQVRPDPSQACAQWRRRIVIGCVPGYPVLHPEYLAPATR